VAPLLKLPQLGSGADHETTDRALVFASDRPVIVDQLA
ncbi:uncharacterized protein METZ01_LOCUS484663, partial [marine metagenome]